ncbi:MAG: phosphoenolpyruvate synthase [Patescibacteria group bacterium]
MRTEEKRSERFTLWFREVGKKDVELVGGKNASLGEMYNALAHLGVKVPNGFAITTSAYRYFLSQGGIEKRLGQILRTLKKDFSNLDQIANAARRLILAHPFPKDLCEAIGEAYGALNGKSHKKQEGALLDVAVRSSANAEDLDKASFAGQLETFLHIRGGEEVIKATHRCFASNFTPRAIDYRERLGYDHLNALVGVGVQKMVRSDKGSSGVAFTIDTNTGFLDVVIVNAGFGLGELNVGGKVNLDEYIVSKTLLKEGYRAVIETSLVRKERKMIYSSWQRDPTTIAPVSSEEQWKPVLTEDEVLEIARAAIAIEDHYKKPMDIEWARDGISGEMFIVQARPVTGIKKQEMKIVEYAIDTKKKLTKLLEGVSVGDKIVHGKVRIIENFKDISTFKEGEVLVTRMTVPSWEPAMRKAAAIITDEGGRKCHAAIVAGEAGIPCVVGTLRATKILKEGQLVTIDCSRGDAGFIYKGIAAFRRERISLKQFSKPKLHLMLFVNRPSGVFAKHAIPNDGVGLARTEFIITETLRNIHPMAWLKYPKLPRLVKKAIDECSASYRDKRQYFVDRLAQSWGKIAATFYPKPVIVRFSDFKSNEYADLIGGKEFEPRQESNPMMGLRGAARYLHPSYLPAFELECAAVKKAREVFGFKNIIPMIPFCRTPEEGKRVLKLMEQCGLKRGTNGLRVYVMIEIPSNVFLADQFAELFDGFSIGSNDLTQLVYGVDRDSGELAHMVNEDHEGVRRAIKHVIDVAHAKGIKVGICGQAPSYLMDFTRFLVESGIDSITLDSSSLGLYQKTAESISNFEKKS